MEMKKQIEEEKRKIAEKEAEEKRKELEEKLGRQGGKIEIVPYNSKRGEPQDPDIVEKRQKIKDVSR